jgi:mono/diheme cytochrome c family protein
MRALGVVGVALVFASPALATTGSPLAGKIVYKATCATCHTLKAAAAVAHSPNAGPMLTNKHETVAKIMAEMSGANTGLMPIYVGRLTPKQINDVVAFVVAASKPGVTVVK